VMTTDPLPEITHLRTVGLLVDVTRATVSPER
jgi:hypothetical protein